MLVLIDGKVSFMGLSKCNGGCRVISGAVFIMTTPGLTGECPAFPCLVSLLVQPGLRNIRSFDSFRS